MKRVLTLAVLLALCVPAFSQQKILFDASKAQMAGNADWVIDADVWNLGYNSTGAMVVGANNDSNPVVTPTPAQSGITSTTAETYWKGGLSAWAVEMVKRGYIVESLPYNGSITFGNTSNPRDLSNYKVFVVDEPNIKFTAAEKNAIVNFVAAGGGLFVIADHNLSDRNNDGWDSPHIWNDLFSTNTVKVNPFGMTFDYVDFSQTSSNVGNYPADQVLHGPAGNVTQMKFSNGTSIKLSSSANSTVRGLVYKTGSSNTGTTNALAAKCGYGTGRVVALGDSSPTDDGTGDPNDVLYNGFTGDVSGNHKVFLVNATLWLAGVGPLLAPVEGGSNVDPGPAAFAVFPNPGSSVLNVATGGAFTSLTICDATGQTLFEQTLAPGIDLTTVETARWQQGLYLVYLKNDTETQVTKWLKL